MIRSEEITIDMLASLSSKQGRMSGASSRVITVSSISGTGSKDGGQALPDWPGHSGTHQHGRELHFTTIPCRLHQRSHEEAAECAELKKCETDEKIQHNTPQTMQMQGSF